MLRGSTFLAVALLGVAALAAVASLMARSGPVALESKRGLVRENAELRSEVASLQRRLGPGHRGGGRASAGESLSDRMQWAKAELSHIRGRRMHTQQLRIKEVGEVTTPQLMPGDFAPVGKSPAHTMNPPTAPMPPRAATGNAASDNQYWPGSEPWVKTFHNGEQLDAMTTPNGDTNPISVLKPGDQWKDPYDRPFLQAPYPHDPSSTLAKTTTGDYASPATWGDIYHSKQTIDWCTSYFPFFNDRIKCIKKLHPSGPLLG